ncbi:MULTISPECIES: electron transport complex subunit RsxC [Treponema]|uniref:electron transport complex subunit RsxC n=1 Tax=Treponema TaxID=157 RepID=UPI0002B58020|nr:MULTISPECIES: electron transport complex subunit RsxC [Treponema]EMB44782.1 electron transport complex, rnfabcdge type, C subunit [Treponema denticola ASLM]EMD56874.1 electron transport complex, rnfabcdge type, C subunit [Treponema denticola US-Trep]UTD10606.1 electron transport complex subunit RsxC [Treponema sp. B152]
MGIKSFKGGVHPPERKAVSPSDSVIRVLPSNKSVWIPITQGGMPNTPLVSVGDLVARGQKIAETDKFMSAPVHSSVSGKVKKIEPHLVTGNTENLCFLIEIDEENREEFMPPLDPFTCTKEEALKRVRDAGITGMGGASFPTHVKLSPPPDAKIEYVIANGAECEPYLCTDAATIFNDSDSIVDGLAITMRIVGAKQGIIALEDNKKDLVPVLEKAISKIKANPIAAGAYDISVQLCKTKYPQGGEKTLTDAVVNREIPSGGLPFQIGCVIQNVGTLKAISEAFRLGKPLIDRALTIGGGACEKPLNVIAPIGTCVGDLIPSVVSLKPGVVKIISGGPMMGFAMKNADFPIQKNTSGVLFLTKEEISLEEESPCIGCGKCIDVCSCHLSPVLIVRALNAGNTEEAIRCGLLDCVECGTCAYTCPARIKLVQRVKIGKQIAREEKQKRDAKAAAKAAAAEKKAAEAQKQEPEAKKTEEGGK